MPYIIVKTNGKTLTTVSDASLDTTTSIPLVGRNYSGYGQVFNENFVKLLENFSNPTSPTKPLQGQLWFNSSSKTLNFSYDGKGFKGLANIFVSDNTPTSIELTAGDFWWDTALHNLKVWGGSSFSVIGPVSAATSKAFWSPDTVSTDYYSDLPVLKANLDNQTIAVISYKSFQPTDPSDLYSNNYTTVSAGISLPGADENGSTEDSGYIFLGTASHSRYASKVKTASTSSTATYYVPMVESTTGIQSVATTSSVHFSNNSLYAPVMQTGSYANTASINVSVPTPVAGMIVFNYGTSKFQGYDGSSWVNLN
jgi:hypothetical protein